MSKPARQAGQKRGPAAERLNAEAAAFREGDRGAFRKLVDALTRPLIAMAWRYTRDWESARDICQETWIRVHEQITRYDPERPFRPWLYAICRNLCLSHLRLASRRRERPTSEPALRRLALADPQAGPEARLEHREFGKFLGAAMRELSEQQRRVFALVDIEQRDQDEAAGLLGMKYTTLRTTLHLARRKIADRLRKLEEES